MRCVQSISPPRLILFTSQQYMDRVKARQAEAFIQLIVNNGRNFTFLNFFKSITVVKEIPLHANQLLVLRLIASHASHTLPPLPWRNTDTDDVMYHSSLLEVLSLCAYGNFPIALYCFH